MRLVDKILIKLNTEKEFFLNQKMGWTKSKPDEIPKYKLKPYLPANAVMIDCGAHVGSDAVELARIFPQSTVHCFEPVPNVFNALRHNTRKYANIHCHQLALSGSDGKAMMFVSSGASDASSSLNKPKDHLIDHPSVTFDNQVEVNMKSLDSWAAGNHISVIDFLWLDMQGHEFAMLKECVKILPGVKAIHSEVSVKETYEGALLYPEYRSWLESKGFAVAIEAIPAGADMGNVLFIRK